MKTHRFEIIKQMRENRKTYQEIADVLKISKQRVHQIYKDYSPISQSKRFSVLYRDNGICAICDSEENLEIHHINGIRSDNDLDNLATLCRKCHIRIEKNDRKINKKPEQKFYKNVKQERKCLKCGKDFSVLPYKIKRGVGKYCSKKCVSDSRIIYKSKEDFNKMRALKTRIWYAKNKDAKGFKEKKREENKLYAEKMRHKCLDCNNIIIMYSKKCRSCSKKLSTSTN